MVESDVGRTWRPVARPHLTAKAEELLVILQRDAFQTPPTFEKPIGGLAGAYSLRINIHNRLVYEVFAEEHVVRVLRMWHARRVMARPVAMS